MSELDRLISCIQDGYTIQKAQTENDLRELFDGSKTNIAQAFKGRLPELMERAKEDPDPVASIREYLLWDYIAYNVAELYNSYALIKGMLEDELKEGNEG